MKVAIITDQHFGTRNDSSHFLDYYEKFYTETFFPKIDEEGITTLLILGDTFDRRKYVNFNSLKRAKEMFFDKLADRNIRVEMIAGNHDTYFKNTNKVNSPDLLLEEYANINVIDHPTTIYVDEIPICMVPWICAENYMDSMDTVSDTKAQICMGHFEISGFHMYRGMHSEEGLDRKIFKKFDMVFSGHYHHRHNQDNIYYLGNPYELYWNDYADPRGFHFFDLNTRELEFVQNPNIMFHRIVYDDKEQSVTEIVNQDLDQYTNKYVKVVVKTKSNPYVFDSFINKLYNVNPIDVTIAEDFIEVSEGIEEIMVDQAQDTLTILNSFVDQTSPDDIDTNKLKGILRELYVEAINLEEV